MATDYYAVVGFTRTVANPVSIFRVTPETCEVYDKGLGKWRYEPHFTKYIEGELGAEPISKPAADRIIARWAAAPATT